MHPKLNGCRPGVGQGLQSSMCAARRPHLFLAILLTLGLLSQRTLSRRFIAEHGTAMTGMFSDDVPEVAELPVAEAGAGPELASSPQPEPLLTRLDDCPTEVWWRSWMCTVPGFVEARCARWADARLRTPAPRSWTFSPRARLSSRW